MAELIWAARKLAALLPKKLNLATGPKSRRAFPESALIQCLEQEAVPAIRELWGRPSFQRVAQGPLKTLLNGCDSQERVLLAELKQAIRQFADELAKGSKKYSRVLRKHLPAVSVQLSKLAARHVKIPPLTLKVLQKQLKAIKDYCSSEWVSAEDYFGPTYETFALVSDRKYLQRGDLIPGLRHDLHHVGNFVARCMLIRGNGALNSLAESYQLMHCALLAARSRHDEPWQAELEAVRTSESALRRACLESRDAVIAESAMILVQVCAEFSRPPPDLSWLPVPACSRKRYAGRLRHALNSGHDADTGELIRYALENTHAWWQRRPAGQTEREEAIAAGGLVLDEGALQAYWKNKLMKTNWSRNREAWRLLLALAKARGNYVTAMSFYTSRNKDVGNSALPNLKGDLAMKLPPDLRRCIKAGGKGGYRLELPGSQVYILEIQA